MVERKVFLGYLNREFSSNPSSDFQPYKNKLKSCENLLSSSLFLFHDIMILYYESLTEGIDPHHLLSGVLELLKPWPIGEDVFFIPMTNIFHYNRPINEEHWRKRDIVPQPQGLLARVKPDMLSSYIYYHYILQETITKERDKYGAIYLMGDYLFFYRELSGEIEFPTYQGKVNGVIPGNWKALMNEHFVFWENEQEPWCKMEILI